MLVLLGGNRNGVAEVTFRNAVVAAIIYIVIVVLQSAIVNDFAAEK